ncbi:MAG: CPBP family intramembrane glutamic endopeptidase [Chitinophagaceae bacterium]
MNKQTAIPKALHFFLTKIIIGIAVVGGSVALTEWSGRLLLDKTQLTDNSKNVIIAISDAAIALLSYILLFRAYEKRQIKELSSLAFGKNAMIGFATGLVLQSLFILVIYMTDGYSVIKINPFSFLVPAFTTALTAGFVAEILIRSVFFRLLEEKSGTKIALLILTLLFGLLHLNVAGATALSVFTTAIQAGLLLSAAYVFTRSLWVTIFFHFAWDFAEPGIFGAANPGNTIEQSLFTSKITGPVYLTGGQSGPQNSIQALLFCSIAALLFLWLAKRNNTFIKPFWKK